MNNQTEQTDFHQERLKQLQETLDTLLLLSGRLQGLVKVLPEPNWLETKAAESVSAAVLTADGVLNLTQQLWRFSRINTPPQ